MKPFDTVFNVFCCLELAGIVVCCTMIGAVTDMINPKNKWFILVFVNQTSHVGNNFCRQLHSDREPIPDVPAVYFVMPTEENIQRITRVRCCDFQRTFVLLCCASCNLTLFILVGESPSLCSDF